VPTYRVVHVSRVVAIGVGLVLVGVTAVAAAIGFSYDQRQAAVERTDIRRVALRSLMSELDGLVATTHQVAGLFESSNGVSRTEFSTFTLPMLRDGSASAFGWVQHVDDADRARFERATGHTIKQLTADGRAVVASRRPSYDASRFIAQADPGPVPLGVDASADPTRRRALAASVRLNEPQAAAVPHLAGSKEPGILVYAPVWRPDGDLEGAALGAFRLPELVASIAGMLPEDAAFELRQGAHRVGGHGTLRDGADAWTVDIAGQQWDLRTSPPPTSRLSWGLIALVVGGLITTIVLLTLSQMARETGRAQRKASQSEERFANAFDNAPVGMALLRPDGVHARVNEALASMLGLSREELTGLPASAIMPPEEAAASSALVSALVRGDQTSFRGDTTLLTADGRRLRAAVHMTLLQQTADGDAPILVHAVDVTEQRLAERRIRHLADHDALTGLLNRRGFAAAIQTQVAQSRRYGTAGALLILDLDGFKAVNDAHGHEAGDRLLVGVARELRTCLRETDVIARLGGDEFAVILPRETVDEAALVAE
jgi:PAS domain S-box-containing protein